jgi:hypothetical protein
VCSSDLSGGTGTDFTLKAKNLTNPYNLQMPMMAILYFQKFQLEIELFTMLFM